MATDLDNDPINYLSKSERQQMGDVVSKMTVPQIMDLRTQAQVLKNQYRTYAMQQKPVPTTIFESATVTKIDILNTQKSVNGVNYIAQRAAAQGNKEGKDILDKFAQNFYGDKIIRDSAGLNPIQSIQRYNDFEASKSTELNQAQTIAQNEDQFNRLQQRVGTTTPNPSNNSILDPDKGYLSNFKDKDAVLQLIKSCIPCEFRKLDFSAEFSVPWANTLNDLKAKWKDLLKMLRDLTTFKPGEFSTDLCNLFKFLDGQCIPDITGMMSLLSMMQLKYMDLSTGSLSSLINQLIAPFLTPLIGSFTSNLDQYSDLIIGPLKCVTRALEHQIITLQDQINGARNIADLNANKFYQKQIDFYDAKIKSLRNRKLQLDKDRDARAIRTAGGTGADVKLDGDVITPQPYAQYAQGTAPDLTRQERIVQTKLISGGIRIGGTQTTDGDKGFQLESDAEREQITKEIDDIQKKKLTIRAKLADNTSYTPTNFNSAISITRQTEFALTNFQKSFKSIISDLTSAINDGINIVKQSIDIYRDEFQRLILNRVTTQQDQLDFTRLLQKIARLQSIVGAVSDFKKAGWDLKKFCERGDANALAQVAKGIKQNDNHGMFDFYQATDSNGNPLILIAPGGAKVNVSSIDFGDVNNDALFADATFNLDSVTKTVTFNDLNEVDKLNRNGIVPDLGNIDSKKIELSNNFKVGSELDLHFKTSYAIISNEFCSKSAINFGSSDTVKQWAASLWQKN